MAERNYWYIKDNKIHKGIMDFKWEPGMAKSQRTKSCHNLHNKLIEKDFKPIDISSASYNELGVNLSAFNLKYKERSVECLYQGSKVYAKYGVHHFLYDADSITAKKHGRDTCDRVVGFNFYGEEFPLEPKTVFYDYLYIQGMIETYGKDLDLSEYNCFTDIQAKIDIYACQARAVAEFVLLQQQEAFDILDNLDDFVNWYRESVEVCDYVNDDQNQNEGSLNSKEF